MVNKDDKSSYAIHNKYSHIVQGNQMQYCLHAYFRSTFFEAIGSQGITT